MKRPLITALALAAFASPAIAGDFASDSAESRLRGCLLAGSTTSSQATLEAKVIEVRAFCGAQINRVRDQRTAGLSGDAKSSAVRKLNTEIAQAIANFSGLKLDDAQDR
ncbi:MAG TPA: hypothetical protein VL393_10900 [Candidatus Binataceae bacterium]|nr:hypothetical protein [Candidatus Binataceae bacterium]